MKKLFSAALLVLVLAGLVGAGQAAPRAALTDDLIAYWKLDEASGVRVDQLSGCGGSGCDLTDNNTVGSGPGVLGDAAYFIPANSEHLSRVDHADLSTGGTDFSVSAWFSTTNAATTQYVLGKGGAPSYEYLVYIYSGALYFQIYDGVGGYDEVSRPISSNTRYFFAAWQTTGGEMGLTVDSSTITKTTAVATTDTASPFTIGNWSISESPYWHSGWVDEVAFFKKALSPSEITTLFNGGAGCQYEYLDTGCAAPTATPTITPTPGPTNTPTNTPLPTNTPTLTPVPTNTPLPTSTPVGEYQVVLSDGQVGIVENRFTTADVVEIVLLSVIAGGDILWRARQQSRGLK